MKARDARRELSKPIAAALVVLAAKLDVEERQRAAPRRHGESYSR
jgi:hypothetical protein